MGVNSLPKTVTRVFNPLKFVHYRASWLRFEPRPYYTRVQYAYHSAGFVWLLWLWSGHITVHCNSLSVRVFVLRSQV